MATKTSHRQKYKSNRYHTYDAGQRKPRNDTIFTKTFSKFQALVNCKLDNYDNYQDFLEDFEKLYDNYDRVPNNFQHGEDVKNFMFAISLGDGFKDWLDSLSRHENIAGCDPYQGETIRWQDFEERVCAKVVRDNFCRHPVPNPSGVFTYRNIFDMRRRGVKRPCENVQGTESDEKRARSLEQSAKDSGKVIIPRGKGPVSRSRELGWPMVASLESFAD